MLETIIAIIITTLLGCVAFFIVRWMNQADVRIDSCHERHEKSEKRINRLENTSLNKHDFEMQIQRLDKADKEQKAYMYGIEGRTANIDNRLIQVEKGQEK